MFLVSAAEEWRKVCPVRYASLLVDEVGAPGERPDSKYRSRDSMLLQRSTQTRSLH